jgi:hypothetical protein
MEKQTVLELIRRELPDVLQENEDLRDWVIQLTHRRYADRAETENRFDRLIEELKLDREENARRWDEHNRKADEKWDEQNRKWDEHNRKADEKWDEQNRKWDENQKVIREILNRLDVQEQKHNASIGALGARWGLYSEASFRNGLKAILEKSFGVKVDNVTEFDSEGRVFGHPDQVELDVIIYNGLLILCEIKSSLSKADIVAFKRKTDFYETKHQRTADRKLMISPMVDERARPFAEQAGIEIYSHSIDVQP